MVPKQKATPPLFQQIVDDAFRAVSRSDLFDDVMIGELRKLVEDHKLSDAGAIVKVLQGPKE